ncbi:MAG TPA: ABC transporter substrate-binding protein, partial [Alphaproteobacteria bacterium]|nr:ABC transporter substrate-binding protein [Alphaproteobacteria bacterium]
SAPAAISTTNFIDADLKKLGFANIAREYFSAGTKDFSALLTKAKQIQPKVIFCGCYNIEGGLIVRSARASGVTQPFVSWDVFNTPEVWEITGPAGNGTVFVSDPPFEGIPSAKGLVTSLTAEKAQPQTYHFYTYASFQVLQQAVKAAQSLDPQKVADAIRKGRFDTAIGDISYSQNGDLKEAKYELYIRKDNQTVPLKE